VVATQGPCDRYESSLRLVRWLVTWESGGGIRPMIAFWMVPDLLTAVIIMQAAEPDGGLRRGCYPVPDGGLWLRKTLVPSGLRAVVVPSGFSVTVQPSRWIMI
jgi:hypothetical protein